MKQKPDETLDHWVRQTLRQLPDTPLPGSSFDSERLWAQLHPELQATASRKKMGSAWWLAAACLAGLGLGWFWLYPLTADMNGVALHRTVRQTNTPVAVRRTPNSADEVNIAPIVAGKKSVMKRSMVKLARVQPRRTESSAGSARIRSGELASHEGVTQVSEVLPVGETAPVSGKLPELRKPTVAVTTQKRRFKVIHENELRAEEEARPKLYRADHFVRLGNGRGEEPAPEAQQPVLRVPLFSKPN